MGWGSTHFVKICKFIDINMHKLLTFLQKKNYAASQKKLVFFKVFF